MAKGFMKDGKFRPTGNKGSSSREKSTKPVGLKFKPTKERQKEEQESLDFQLGRERGKVTRIDLEIDPKIFLKAVLNDPNWTPAHGKDSMLNIKKRIEQGKPLDKPFLIILKHKNKKDEVIGHQGRHRVVTARELGIKKIPVEIYCKKGEFFANCKSIDQQDLLDAISQMQSKMEEDEENRIRNEGWEEFRKEVKRLSKKKHMSSDEERQLFEAENDLKRHDAFKKLADEVSKEEEEKSKKIKEIFN